MPTLTGLGLAADVARIRADLPVVIHSGHISDSVRSEAARLGVRGVVHKGGSFDELGAVVQRILQSCTALAPTLPHVPPQTPLN